MAEAKAKGGGKRPKIGATYPGGHDQMMRDMEAHGYGGKPPSKRKPKARPKAKTRDERRQDAVTARAKKAKKKLDAERRRRKTYLPPLP